MTTYRLLSLIGQGGMSEVWRAEGTKAGDRPFPCAVKRLLPEGARDAELRNRLAAEERVLRRLDHPAVVRLRDAYDDAGRRHLVLDYVDGLTLEALCLRGAGGAFLPPQAASGVVQALAAALAHAHGRGVLHRDVSAANVLLSWDGAVKLADFGIAQDGDGPGLTATGFVVGTGPYLSPRRRQGHPATAADDHYSLGVVVERLLAAMDPRARRDAVARDLRAVAALLRADATDDRDEALALVAGLAVDEDALTSHLARLERPAPSAARAALRHDASGTTMPEVPARRR